MADVGTQCSISAVAARVVIVAVPTIWRMRVVASYVHAVGRCRASTNNSCRIANHTRMLGTLASAQTAVAVCSGLHAPIAKINAASKPGQVAKNPNAAVAAPGAAVPGQVAINKKTTDV